MSLVVYLNSVNSTKFDQPMYTVIHMQDPGSVRVNQDHGSLASLVGSRVTSLPGRVGSRVSVADPVSSLLYTGYGVVCGSSWSAIDNHCHPVEYADYNSLLYKYGLRFI